MDLSTETKKASSVYKRLDYVLKIVNYPRFHSQHIWADIDPIDTHSKKKEYFLDNKDNIDMGSEYCEKNGYGHNLEL